MHDPAGFETVIPAFERQQDYALHLAVTEIGSMKINEVKRKERRKLYIN
jgi:hypothetical protein